MGEMGKGEFEGMVVGLPKSHQVIVARIDRLAVEFRKNGIPGGIRELERDGDQNSGDWGKYGRGVNIWIITPFRKYRG